MEWTERTKRGKPLFWSSPGFIKEEPLMVPTSLQSKPSLFFSALPHHWEVVYWRAHRSCTLGLLKFFTFTNSLTVGSPNVILCGWLGSKHRVTYLLNRWGRWGTTGDFTNQFPPFFCCPLSRSGELRTQKLKVPSDENTELKRSPFKAWSRSVYSHICCAYCEGFLPC